MWIIYDPDGNTLVTTEVFDSYDDALELACQVDDVLILEVKYP